MIFCGLLGVASAGVGFAAGSAMFKSVWRVWNKDRAQNLQEVENTQRTCQAPIQLFFSLFQLSHYIYSQVHTEGKT